MEREIGSQTMVVPFGAHEGKLAKILRRETSLNGDGATKYKLEVEGAIFWLTVPQATGNVAERAAEHPALRRELGT